MAHYSKVIVQPSSYRSYVATVVQSSSSAPYSDVLFNTLGYTPVWSRTSAGIYTLNASEFTSELSNKIVVFYNSGMYAPASYPDSGVMFHSEALWSQDTFELMLRTGYMVHCNEANCSDIFEFVPTDGYTNSSISTTFFKASLELRIYN